MFITCKPDCLTFVFVQSGDDKQRLDELLGDDLGRLLSLVLLTGEDKIRVESGKFVSKYLAPLATFCGEMPFAGWYLWKYFGKGVFDQNEFVHVLVEARLSCLWHDRRSKTTCYCRLLLLRTGIAHVFFEGLGKGVAF